MKWRPSFSRNQLDFEPFRSKTTSSSEALTPEKQTVADGPWSAEEELVLLARQLQSEKLPPLQAAQGYRRLMQAPYELSPSQIARALGQEPARVREMIALLAFPPELQKMLERDELSLAHFQVLRRLRRDGDMIELGRQARARKWSVEALEHHVNTFLGEIEKAEESKARAQLEKLLAPGMADKAVSTETDPLMPVWTRMHHEPSLHLLGEWDVQYCGGLRWNFGIKPRTADAGASRIRLAEWFRRMAELLEGRRGR